MIYLLRCFILFVFVFFVPDIAFAFDTNEIVTYGYSEITAGVLTAASMFINSSAFTVLLGIVAAFGLSYLIIVTGVYEKDWRKVIYGFFYVTLIYSALILVKVNVTVRNQTAPYNTITVNNVPWGLGFIPSVITNTGDIITEKMEEYFNVPASFAYSQRGLIYPVRLFDAIPKVSPSSQYLIKNVENYFIDCGIAIDYSEGIYSWDDLWSATDIWTALAPSANGPFPVSIFTLSGSVWTPAETTCDTAYTTIRTQYQTDYGNQVKQMALDSDLGITTTAEFEADFDESNLYYGAISQTAAKTIENAAFMKALDSAFDYADLQSGGQPGMYALTTSQAEMNQRTQQYMGGWLSAQNVPVMRGFFEAFMYATFIVLCFFMINPLAGWKYFVSYVTYLVWLAMWGPMFTIVNFVLSYGVKSKLALAGYNVLSGSNCGACMIGLSGVSAISDKWVGMVESYVGVVPLVSLVLLTAGSAYGFVQLASATKGASDSAASSAGKGMSTGEIRMGNVSMNKADVTKVSNAGFNESTVGGSKNAIEIMGTDGKPYTTVKQGGERTTGYFEKLGSPYPSKPTIDMPPGVRAPFQVSEGESMGHAIQSKISDSYNQAFSSRQALVSGFGDSLNSLSRFDEMASQGNGFSDAERSDKTWQYSKMAGEIKSNIGSIAKSAGVDESTVRNDVMTKAFSVGAGGKLGFELFGTGGSVHADLSSGQSSHYTTDDAYRKRVDEAASKITNLSTDEKAGFIEAGGKAKQAMKTGDIKTAVSTGESFSKDDFKRYSNEFSSSLNEAHALEKVASETKQSSLEMKKDITGEFVDYVAHEMGMNRKGAAIILSDWKEQGSKKFDDFYDEFSKTRYAGVVGDRVAEKMKEGENVRDTVRIGEGRMEGTAWVDDWLYDGMKGLQKLAPEERVKKIESLQGELEKMRMGIDAEEKGIRVESKAVQEHAKDKYDTDVKELKTKDISMERQASEMRGGIKDNIVEPSITTPVLNQGKEIGKTVSEAASIVSDTMKDLKKEVLDTKKAEASTLKDKTVLDKQMEKMQGFKKPGV